MDYIEKNKLLIILVAIMTLLNIVSISLILLLPLRPPQHPPRAGRDPGQDFIERELKFTAEQQKRYAELRRVHFKEMDSIMRACSEASKALFDLLKQERVSDELVRAKAAMLGQLEIERSVATFMHFCDLRELCSPEQQLKFDTVIADVLMKMRESGMKREGRPEGEPPEMGPRTDREPMPMPPPEPGFPR